MTKDASIAAEVILQVAREQALRVGLRWDDAEDCASDFLFRAIGRSSRQEARTPQHKSRAWISVCARNYALDRLRALQCRRRRELLATDALSEEGLVEPWESDTIRDPESAAFQGEFWLKVALYVDQLPEPSRRAFVLQHFDQLHVSEIARLLGKSEGAVDQMLRRARRRLRSDFERAGWNREHLIELCSETNVA